MSLDRDTETRGVSGRPPSVIDAFNHLIYISTLFNTPSPSDHESGMKECPPFFQFDCLCRFLPFSHYLSMQSLRPFSSRHSPSFPSLSLPFPLSFLSLRFVLPFHSNLVSAPFHQQSEIMAIVRPYEPPPDYVSYYCRCDYGRSKYGGDRQLIVITVALA